MSLITLNPSDKGERITLSEDNLTAFMNTGQTGASVRATIGKLKGKWYWETHIDSHFFIGYAGLVLSKSISINNSPYVNQGRCAYANTDSRSTGNLVDDVVGDQDGYPGYTTGDTIGVAINLDADPKVANFYKNGEFVVKGTIAFVGEVYPAIGVGAVDGGVATINFGATPFKYVIPDGYLPYDIENARWFSQYLIKQGSNYYTIKSKFYENGEYLPVILDGGLTPNVNDFENYGSVDVGDLVKPISKILLNMEEDSIVGEGKTYRKTISGYGKILGIRNLD